MTDLFRGTGVALATPMKEDYSIDFDSLNRLVTHCIDGGVDYLVVMGTTGESPVFSWEEKVRILETVKEINNNRLPIVYGHGGNNTFSLIEELKKVNALDVAGILTVCPYYNKPSQAGLFKHFSMIAEASGHPIILYNVPARTSSNLEAQTTIALAKYDKIVAIKEASGDFNQIQQILEHRPAGFELLSGEDSQTHEMIKKGAVGVISVAANLFTREFSTMVNATLKGDGSDEDAILKEVYRLLSTEGNPTSLKMALKLSGIIDHSTLRPPLVEASDELTRLWRNYLDKQA